MATTAESIREELEKKADRRINPLLKGLSMLTGGIAGELTGTNEQMRQQRRARAVLLEEQQRQMAEQRVADRVKLQREEELKDSIKRAAIEREAAALDEARRLQGETMVARGEDATMVGPLDPQTALGVTRAKAAIAKAEYDRIRQLEGRRGEMTGYLSAQGVQTGEPDIETLAFLESQQKAREDIKKAKKDVTMQLTTKSGSTVYGTYDELASRFPDEVKNISVAKEKPANISGRLVRNEFGQLVPTIDFGPGVTPKQIYDFSVEMEKQLGIKPEQGKPEPAPGTPKIIGQGPAGAAGAPQVSRFGGTRAAAAPTVATQSTAPTMGTPTAEEGYSIWTGRYPGQPEPVLGTVNLRDVAPTAEGIRGFLGPLGESVSGAAERYAAPIPTRRSSEMFADPEAYKQYLRKQMGGY
jgi:hypothetical protein